MTTTTTKKEAPAKTGLFTYTRLMPGGMAGWVYLVTTFYDGEPFDYLFSLDDPQMTEKQALDLTKLDGFDLRARANFLRDVKLETKQ